MTSLGTKRTCQSCSAKYYDFNKSPIICPSCGAEFDPDIFLKSRKGRSLSSKVSSENNNDISEIDEISLESDEEVESDDDSLLEIDKQNDETENQVEINIDEDISFIEDEEISDDETSLEIMDDKDK